MYIFPHRSTFHGSLRKSPKSTPAALVEEEDTPKPQKTEKEPRLVTDAVGERTTSTNTATGTLNATFTVTATPLVSTVTSTASTLSSTTTTATTVGVTTSSLTQNPTPNITTVGGTSANTSQNSREAGNSTLKTEKQSHTEPEVGF